MIDERKQYKYSLIEFEEGGDVSRRQDVNLPLEELNSIYASAELLKSTATTAQRPSLFYDSIAGVAQMVFIDERSKLTFDGTCVEVDATF